ncbi:hypothetical protein [Flavobacterium sp. ZB4P13]|uniref:hypothetical protein n=1 Tax=Flavobacterium sp. ZB4P13 TaxID=3401728 RepID=UPI003AAB3A83
MINPKQKTVAVGGMTGGVTWDGYKYTVDPKINFDTTNLIFIGDHIFIKEHFPFNCDFNNIEVIKSNDQLVIFSDKNKIYTYWAGHGSSEIDISKFKKLSNNIYKDLNGDLMLLTGDYELQLARIQQPNEIDLNTVEYVTNNYIKDKNGLYLCPKYGDNSNSIVRKLTKICSSNGVNSNPIVTKNYFIYGEKVFGTADTPSELKLNKAKMWEIVINEYSNYSLLTDGKRTYENWRDGYKIFDFKTDRRRTNVTFFEGIDIKYVFSNNLKFIPKNETDLLFKGTQDFGNQDSGTVIQTSNGYYFIPFGGNNKIRKINNIFIYNIDTKKEEELNQKKFKYLKDNVYTYKNHLFFNGMPVHTTMDIKNIKLLYKGDNKTDFISDGKKTMCIGNRTGYKSKKINDTDFVLIEENIIDDFSKLKTINQNILIDDKNIYNRDIVIPIQKIGIPIKVYQ